MFEKLVSCLIISFSVSLSIVRPETDGIFGNYSNRILLVARLGMLEDLKLLMEASGENFENEASRDERGMTPFLYAAQEGHDDIVEYLLIRSNGTVLHDRDNDGASAMFYAAARDHISTVKLLHQNGANMGWYDAALPDK